MARYELGIIGGGNMAEAILHGAIGGGILSASEVVVSDPLPERREHVARAAGAACVADNAVAAGCPRVVLAVKPQKMAAVLAEAASSVAADALVISIAAGIDTGRIDAMLGGRGRIVRVMPNTPMQAGAGMSALSEGPRATQADLEWVRKLFSASGKTCVVPERLMDAVTAVSGSGPAYFFYLIEAMIEAGQAEGLDRKTARTLSVQTCAGAARLLEHTGEDPHALRVKVTSPGGTTQRAVETLDSANAKDTIVRAVRAAAARSRELRG